MSCIWRELPPQGWQALAVPVDRPLSVGLAGVELLDVRVGAERGALLMARPGLRVRVNGQPIVGGIRVLEHRDEITAGPHRFYFSVETSPHVVAFRVPEGERAPTCPICRGPIRDATQAVQCPGCARWFHQVEAAEGRPAKPCWTYAPTCRFCSHPTAFGAESTWKPETEDGRD